MKLNKFLWEIYKKSEQGQKAIELFTNFELTEILEQYGGVLDIKSTEDSILELVELSESPTLPEKLTLEEAEELFESIIKSGFSLKNENGNIENFSPEEYDLLALIPEISTWLYANYPDFFKPYLLKNKFHLLTQIADNFGIELPEVPLKRYKEERLRYYWDLCLSFISFQEENNLTGAEFCAFLYDFAPNYIAKNEQSILELPKPTQVWLVGGNKGDFAFLDNIEIRKTHHWQGNEDTKRGDIIVMYCLAPRSYIHSVWRATTDGIADPFFHYYSNIYIGDGKKVKPVSHNDLKEDDYFSKNPLVKKNLQGVSGYAFSSSDYQRLQELIIKNGGDIENLPQLYSPTFSLNENLNNERDVEIALIEPLLVELGYTNEHWVRQLPVRMGRGERNFPDYAFLTKKEKNYEEASMLIEAKYLIKNNKELEDTFKQVWSYGQRLSANVLVIADKVAIWIYQKHGESFDRSKYVKKYWGELQQPDDFKEIKQIIGHN
jgi:Type I restriction enzyme R protein N terminus (HSDR_N)